MVDNVSRLELLRMAKEMVINEHIDRRAELHNKWVSESESVWSLRRQRLPYPSIPPYPTEQDILARAKSLLDFIDSQKTSETSIEPEPKIQDTVTDTPPKTAELNTTITETNSTTSEKLEDHSEISDSNTQTEVPNSNLETLSESNNPTAVSKSEILNEIKIDTNEYVRSKVGRDIDNNSSIAGRILPLTLRKLGRSFSNNIE